MQGLHKGQDRDLAQAHQRELEAQTRMFELQAGIQQASRDLKVHWLERGLGLTG
jgi:hypothetical protein